MKLWGTQWNKGELLKRVGDESQVFGVVRSVLGDGPGRGIRLWDIRTGGGLRFSILPDRCMDIANCEYKGIPLAWISKNGLTYPRGSFMKSFTGGLLTTCGLNNVGPACYDLGESLPMHGGIHSVPAENAYAYGEWLSDTEYRICCGGTMRVSEVFGEHLRLTRQLKVMAGENTIALHDTVENCGYEPTPLMLLYHSNFGYPLISENTIIKMDRLQNSRILLTDQMTNPTEAMTLHSPSHCYQEQVFYHDLTGDVDGYAQVDIINKPLGIRVALRYKLNTLPKLMEWKMLGESDYVCGLEPATWYPKGRNAAREAGELLFIQPQQAMDFYLEWTVSE